MMTIRSLVRILGYHWHRGVRPDWSRLRRSRLRLERLDDRIVPANYPIFANLTGVTHAEYSNNSGSDSQDGDFAGVYVHDQGNGMIAEAWAQVDPNDPNFLTGDAFVRATGDFINTSSSASASFNGSFDMVLQAQTGDKVGAKAIIEIEPGSFWRVDPGSTGSYSVNGITNAPYALTTIGGKATVTVSASASASAQYPGNGLSSTIETRAAFDFGGIGDYPTVVSAPDIETKAGEATPNLAWKVPSLRDGYFASDAHGNSPVYSFSFDFNNDGTDDYVFSGTEDQFSRGDYSVPWATLSALGLKPSATPYTYHVRVDEDLGVFGFTGSMSDETNGKLFIDDGDPKLVVTSTKNLDAPDSAMFGPYIPHVSFSVPFTMHLDGAAVPPYKMGYSLDGGRTAVAAKPTSDPFTWTFNLNVGQLKAGKDGIDFGAIDKSFRYIATQHATLDLTAKPDFTLLVAPAGAPAETIAAGDARFVKGPKAPSAPVHFVGEFTDVPTYYQSNLSVFFSGKYWKSPQSTGDTTAKIEFDQDGSKLPTGLDVSTARIGQNSLKASNPEANSVLVITIPKWLNGGAWTFDQTDGHYHVTDAVVSLAPPVKKSLVTPYAWLNPFLKGLDTSNELEATMDVDAPMDMTEDIDWSGSKLHAAAKVLGVPVWDESWDSGKLLVTGKVDGKTLTPVALGLRLKQPEDLGSKTFFNWSVTIPLTPHTPKGLLHASLSFGLILAGDLKADAGVLMTWKNNSVQWDPTGTFVSLNATIDLSPTVSFSATAVGGWLVEITGGATLNLHFHLDGQVSFKGLVTGLPAVASSNYAAWLNGDYHFDVHGKLFKVLSIFDYDSSSDPKLGTIKRVDLFKF